MDVTVLICARNEALNISNVVNDALTQQFDGVYEIIIIDDFSDDNTLQILSELAIQNPKIKIIDLKKYLDESCRLIPNKKAGISIAADMASGEIIMTTDADCRLSQLWVRSMFDCARNTHAAMVCGPVAIESGSGLLNMFQEMDLLAMMAMTEWSIDVKLPMLNNGANLLYRKDLFLELKPYQENAKEYSGDDVFLLQKFIANNHSVTYCQNQNSIVHTKAQQSFMDFFNQRIRWAGKSKSYSNRAVQLFLAGVYLINFLVLGMLLLSLFQPKLLIISVVIFGVKVLLDTFILHAQIIFFGKQRLYVWLLLMDFFHTVYVVFFGVFSFKKSYIWKGRSINR